MEKYLGLCDIFHRLYKKYMYLGLSELSAFTTCLDFCKILGLCDNLKNVDYLGLRVIFMRYVWAWIFGRIRFDVSALSKLGN